MAEEWVLQSITPKSDQLNADDLITGPLDVTVTDVKKGDAEQPISIGIDGGRQPYKPCKSMRRLIIAIWGDKPAKWIGQRMRLFCDPNVTWAGVKVGGIRISHMSGIDKRTSIMLTVTRGKRTEYIVEPMPEAQKPPVKDRMAGLWKFMTAIDAKYKDKDELATWACGVLDVERDVLGDLSQEQVDVLERAANSLLERIDNGS